MHTSDFNKTPSQGSKVRAAIVIASVTGLIMFFGLAAYTWQLQRQIADLTASSDDARLTSLFAEAAADSRSSPAVPGAGSSVNSLFGSHPFASLGMNQPVINLRETDDVLELVIPVQEGQEFEFSTDVQEDRLTVSGTISWQQESNQNGMNSRRQGSSQFSRTVVLPANVDPAGLITEHRENEIVISLPKV